MRNINETIKNGWKFSSLLYTDERKLSAGGKEILRPVQTKQNYILSEKLLDELSEKADISELLAVIQMRDDNSHTIKLSENPLRVLFDRPSNKGNLGTLIRSCDALGANGIIVTGHTVDLYKPTIITAGMGSFFNAPIPRLANNTQIQDILQCLKNKYHDFKVIAPPRIKKDIIQ